MQASSHTPQARERLPILEHQTTRRRATRYGLFAILGAFTAVSAVATYKTMYPNKVVGFGVKVNAGTVQDVKTTLAEPEVCPQRRGAFLSAPGSGRLGDCRLLEMRPSRLHGACAEPGARRQYPVPVPRLAL